MELSQAYFGCSRHGKSFCWPVSCLCTTRLPMGCSLEWAQDPGQQNTLLREKNGRCVDWCGAKYPPPTPTRSGSKILAGWVVGWEAWWAANPTPTLISTRKMGSCGLMEGGKWGLASWASEAWFLVCCWSTATLSSLFPVSLWLWRTPEKMWVRMLFTGTASFTDALVYSCRHGYWCKQVVRYLALPSPGCTGGKIQTFVPRIGRKELRACREGLLSCGSSSSKREFLVCGQRQLRISPGKCSLQLPELPFRRTTTQPFS